MEIAPLGISTRTVLFFIALISITLTTWLWQILLTSGQVDLPSAIAALLLPASVGVIAGYYALHG